MFTHKELMFTRTNPSKYNKVLEQLVERHRMFEKLTEIMGTSDAVLDKYDVQMNKWDDELKYFMLSAEKYAERPKMTILSGTLPSRCGWVEGGSLLDSRSS